MDLRDYARKLKESHSPAASPNPYARDSGSFVPSTPAKKSAAKTTAEKSKKGKKTRNVALYKKGTFVVVKTGRATKFDFVKLLEDVAEGAKTFDGKKLEQDPKNALAYKLPKNSDKINVKDILTTVELKVFKRGREFEVSRVESKRIHQVLENLVSSHIGDMGDDDIYDSEPEEEEDDAEEEGEDEDDDEEEEEEEDEGEEEEEEKEESTQDLSASLVEAVTDSTPKKKRGRPKKETTEPSAKKRKTDTGKKEVKKETKKRATKPKKEKPKVFKKGKLNPLVEEIEVNRMLEDPSDEIFDEGNVYANNKNVIRAVYTGNHKLLEKLLSSHKVISTPQQTWSCDNELSAFEYAIKMNDQTALQKLIDFNDAKKKSKKFWAANPGKILLQVQGTGVFNPMTFSHRVRAIKMSRGNREGNNAFMYDKDSARSSNFFEYGGSDIAQKMAQWNTPMKTVNFLKAKLPSFHDSMQNSIYEAVRAGNRELAGTLVKSIASLGNYGFNHLHDEALNSKDGKLPEFKKVSVTKKAIGNRTITPVHCASIHPNSDVLKTLLDSNDEYNIMDDDWRKPIHYAAACEGPGPLTYLLESKGVIVNDLDKVKTTPLMIAAQFGRVENIKVLLKHGAESALSLKNKNQMGAIHYAAMNGHTEAVKLLIESGVKPNMAGRDRMSPLSFAATYGHLETAEAIVELKGRIVSKDKFKRSPLTMAVRNGHAKVANFILRHGALFDEPDSSGNAPLHYACGYGWIQCIDMLIQAGADVNFKNDWKITPLGIAMLKGNFGCVRRMLENPDVDVNCKDEKGRTLLSLCIDTLDDESFEQVRYLIEDKKADVTMADLSDHTPLHYLCKSKSSFETVKKAIKLLLDHGLDINQLTNTGESAFEVAVKERHYEIAKELLKSGADISESTNIFFTLTSSPFEKELNKFLHDVIKKKQVNLEFINNVDDAGYTPLLRLMSKLSQDTQKRWNELQRQTHYPTNRPYAEVSQQMREELEDITELVKFLVKNGADCKVRVIKLKDYRDTMDVDEQTNGKNTKKPKVQQKEEEEENDDDDYDEDEDEDYDSEEDYDEEEEEEDNYNRQWNTGLFGNQNNAVQADQDPEYYHYNNHGLWNALHFCSSYPILTLFGFLISQGVSLDDQTHRNKDTPLTILLTNMTSPPTSFGPVLKDACLKELFAKSFDVNARTKDGATALLKAISSNDSSSAGLLLEKKADPNVLDNKGNTPLKICVTNKQVELVTLLLDNGADVNMQDNVGRTVLHIALNYSISSADASFDLEELLLERGAEVNILDNRGRSPLHYAFVKIGDPFQNSQMDPIEVVSSLCGKKGIEIDIKDKFGKTPLHYASQRGATISAMCLIQRGAKLEEKDADGNTNLAISILHGHPNYAVLLVQKEAQVDIKANVVRYEIKGVRPPQTVSLADGAYSLFRIAIHRGWQGLAYMMLDHGYNYMLAMEDAMTEGKFRLVLTLLSKISDENVVRQFNDLGQNLFHIFAIHGGHAPSDLSLRILNAFQKWGIDFKAQDSFGKMALHYAANSLFRSLIDFLLPKVDLTTKDKEGYTALAYCFKGHVSDSLTDMVQEFLNRGADINIDVKIIENKEELIVTPLIYAIMRENDTLWLNLNRFLSMGCSVNGKDSFGRTPLMHAVRMNDKSLVDILLRHDKQEKIDREAVDEMGKSVIHHLINPCPYGSYENVEILNLLAKKNFKLNIKDCDKHTPLFFAFQQDSGRLSKALMAHGCKEEKNKLKRAITTVAATEWATQEHHFDEDASEYIKIKESEASAEESKLPADPKVFRGDGRYEVFYQGDEPFDCIMTKIDINNGYHGENMFYRMQLVRDINRDVLILLTRWGRIGDTGQYQQTPFAKEEDAITEFKKIFKSKSANEWEDRDKFEKKPKKYQLLNFSKVVVTHKDLLSPFEFEDLPESDLPKQVQSVMKQITNVAMYKKSMSSRGIDTEVMPLSKLDRGYIVKAKQILIDIAEEHENLKAESKNLSKGSDDYLKIKEKIADLSSRFYELIPHSEFRRSAIEPISNERSLKEKLDLLDSLTDYELATKILFGAHLKEAEVNPLDYVYSVLDIRLEVIHTVTEEFKLLHNYVKNSAAHTKVKNIFRLQRKGEAEKIAPWKELGNNMLLYHGSKLSNFLGIMSQGLKIAPPEAPTTGWMFGKGVYFADMFQKSFGYCHDYCSGGKYDQFMLLCEVALGKPQERLEAHFVEDLPNTKYHSTKGLGRTIPDPRKNVVLPNGVTVPAGTNTSAPEKVDRYGRSKYNLNYNEYIIYDTSQIRMRYLIQIGNDDEE